MLVTLFAQATPQQLQAAVTGQQSLGSGGPIIGGITIGLIIGIVAVVINYRRNHSFFYAFLAFVFSELYLLFVAISAIIGAVTGK